MRSHDALARLEHLTATAATSDLSLHHTGRVFQPLGKRFAGFYRATHILRPSPGGVLSKRMAGFRRCLSGT